MMVFTVAHAAAVTSGFPPKRRRMGAGDKTLCDMPLGEHRTNWCPSTEGFCHRDDVGDNAVDLIPEQVDQDAPSLFVLRQG